MPLKSKRRSKVSAYSYVLFEYKRMRLFLSVYSMYCTALKSGPMGQIHMNTKHVIPFMLKYTGVHAFCRVHYSIPTFGVMFRDFGNCTSVIAERTDLGVMKMVSLFYSEACSISLLHFGSSKLFAENVITVPHE